MKSKVTKFWHIFCVLVLLCLNFIDSAPTFGNEFVHIKVHLPKEDEGHGPPVHAHAPHTIVHASPHSPHKVVHHFHHRKRKPAKKNPFAKHAGLLESILLTELKQPINSDHYKYLNHAEDIAQNIDSFVAKPDLPKPHVETYALIEETVPKQPKQIVETYKVIESKLPQQHDSFDEPYSYKPQGHTETYKVIDGLFDDYHAHFKHSDESYVPAKKQRVKTVKIIDSNEEHDYEQDHAPYAQHGPTHALEHDYPAHAEHVDAGGYHYGSKSHAESVKIVETNAPHQHSEQYSINFGKRPHSETVEIIKSSAPSKSSSYYRKHQRQPAHQYHQHTSYDDHSGLYEAPSAGVSIASSAEDTFAAGYDYKPARHQDSYRTLPSDSYLPPKRAQSDYHHYHHSNVHQNSLYDDESAPPTGFDTPVETPTDTYLPPPLPQTLPGLQHSSSASASASHWPTHDTTYKATETYTGIDSYSAPHVQGVGSSGYQYPSSYA